ncbi:MAG TPA: NAD(P)-binding domain-containing protein [Solirubrobacteraceae bacterium]|jgi:NADPH-dependent 2,4-dienoyl-CoA reductase/sulfur reductase-like enzyme|nr:NAD(P)-binding domain-containing protein [Solirubrobacteraceae bacterium]
MLASRLKVNARAGSTNGAAPRCDVAIVGAGPYGLAVKAALRSADLDVRLFGPPMSFWRERMPEGMLIRSPWVATSFAHPSSGLTLDDYERWLGEPLPRRLPLQRFIEYGEWFQRRTSPQVDERRVARISQHASGFAVELGDGERVHARRVVVATGIERFAVRPSAFDGLAPELALHATELTRPRDFAGCSVVVVGGGQSALESAALLHEAGARVQVLVRQSQVHWLLRSQRLHAMGPVSQLLYAPSDIGPAGLSRLLTFPDAFARIPWRTRTRLDHRAIRPAGSGWLVPRLAQVGIECNVTVLAARPQDGRIALTLSSGEIRRPDHVVLGTGFRPDIARYPFLDRELVRAVRSIDGYPVLNGGFESSVAGLYFLGAIAAGAFGPLLRFVAGAPFASSRVARHLVGAGRVPVAVSGPALETA